MKEFFSGRVDEAYIRKRREVGETHARIGLSLPAYFAAMSISLSILCETLYDGSLGAEQYANAERAITKLMHLDTAVVVATFSEHTSRIISDQQESLLEMSTPVTAIWQDILMIPVVGIIDSKRTQDIMTAVLSKIAETHARALILDISGVAVVDTAVANHLIKVTKATRLMGCTSTISGISPAIAQTIVELGIDVGEIRTTATLHDALREAFAATGVELRKTKV
jgi:rsbT co-antagonist protein RsbR